LSKGLPRRRGPNSFPPTDVRPWEDLPTPLEGDSHRFLSSESAEHVHRQTHEADVSCSVPYGQEGNSRVLIASVPIPPPESIRPPGLRRPLFLVLGIPIRQKLFEPDIGERMLPHLLENRKWHGADVPACERRLDDVLRMPHASDQD